MHASRTLRKLPALRSATLVSATALALSTSLVMAQPAPGSPKSPSPNAPGQSQPESASKSALSQKDKDFVQHIAKGGALQIELSKVEVQHGQNPKEKQFALQTVENMSKAAGMLHAIASNLGMKLPEQPPADVQKLKQALAADNGSLVDSEYIAQMVPASTVAVNLFKDEASNGQNQKLVEFAKQMLPKLEKHQQMAVQISENTGKKTAGQQQPAESSTTGASHGASPAAPQTAPSPNGASKPK